MKQNSGTIFVQNLIGEAILSGFRKKADLIEN